MTSEEFPDALPVGTIVGAYRLTRVIGQGGFGITYEGVSAAGLTARRVAIKEFFPQGHAYRVGTEIRLARNVDQGTWLSVQRRFEAEALKLVDEYDHPAIVKAENFVREHGSSFLIMDYVEGPSLTQWRQGLERPPNEAQIRAVMEPVLDAVAYLHARGEMHRDISPHNILVRTERRGRSVLEPVLIDFGAAGAGLDRERVSSVVVANLTYAPLEQLRPNMGTQGAYTDIYALGGVLYYCVAGKAPLPAEARTAASYLGETDNSYVPARKLGATARFSVAFLFGVDTALNIRPSERPQSVAALRAALGWDGQVASPAPALPAERPQITAAPPPREQPAPVEEATKKAGRPREAPSEPEPAQEAPAKAGLPQGMSAPQGTVQDGPAEDSHRRRRAGAPPALRPAPAVKPRSRRPAYLATLVVVGLLVGLGWLVSGGKRAPDAVAEPTPAPVTKASLSPLRVEAETAAADCEKGNIAQCITAGERFSGIISDVRDLQRAITYYEKACEGDDYRGCSEAGFYLAKEQDARMDPERATLLLIKGCDLGDRLACSAAFTRIDAGVGLPPTAPQARDFLGKLCKSGNPQACALVGVK